MGAGGARERAENKNYRSYNGKKIGKKNLLTGKIYNWLRLEAGKILRDTENLKSGRENFEKGEKELRFCFKIPHLREAAAGKFGNKT